MKCEIAGPIPLYVRLRLIRIAPEILEGTKKSIAGEWLVSRIRLLRFRFVPSAARWNFYRPTMLIMNHRA